MKSKKSIENEFNNPKHPYKEGRNPTAGAIAYYKLALKWVLDKKGG